MRTPDLNVAPDSAEFAAWSAAMRALPLIAPEQSAWPAIASRMHDASEDAAPQIAPRGRTRRLAVWSLAASIAAVSVWLALTGLSPISPASRVASAPDYAAQVDAAATDQQPIDAAQVALIERSAALEWWLRESCSADWPQDLGSATASVEIENLIANVDQRLTRSGSSAEEIQLWRHRVGLLEELVALQGEPIVLSIPARSDARVL